VTKSPRQAVLIPSRTVPPEFDALVKELQQHGARANRSAIASGLLKRDPLAYKRARVKGKKQKFEKYVALAVKARIVTIGLAKGDEGGPTDWITLNPEWRLVAHDEPASVAVSTELAVTSGPDSISEASTSAAHLSRATDVPPLVLSPAGFSLLAERLRIMRSNDVPRPFRSLVAMDLIARDPTVYAQAGVQDFAEYATLAMHAGVVRLGGEGPRAWISSA
jgi:hypothetical protein